jgi:molecular chaperone HtpG
MSTTQKPFDADVAQLIQLVTHSIYSNKDVFLRELIANANDAIQKAKIHAAQDTKYL